MNKAQKEDDPVVSMRGLNRVADVTWRHYKSERANLYLGPAHELKLYGNEGSQAAGMRNLAVFAPARSARSGAHARVTQFC